MHCTQVSRGEVSVDRDGFTSMVRNVLGLELDPEEEDILYVSSIPASIIVSIDSIYLATIC